MKHRTTPARTPAPTRELRRFEAVETVNWRGRSVWEVHSDGLPVLALSGRPYRARSLKRACDIAAELNRQERIRSFLAKREPVNPPHVGGSSKPARPNVENVFVKKRKTTW